MVSARRVKSTSAASASRAGSAGNDLRLCRSIFRRWPNAAAATCSRALRSQGSGAVRGTALGALVLSGLLTFVATSLLFPVATLWGTFQHASGPLLVGLIVLGAIIFVFYPDKSLFPPLPKPNGYDVLVQTAGKLTQGNTSPKEMATNELAALVARRP